MADNMVHMIYKIYYYLVAPTVLKFKCCLNICCLLEGSAVYHFHLSAYLCLNMCLIGHLKDK